MTGLNHKQIIQAQPGVGIEIIRSLWISMGVGPEQELPQDTAEVPQEWTVMRRP